MPAPGTCIVSGTLYNANGVALPNTLVVISVPQQIIGGSVIAVSIASTISNSSGALSPIALPQTAIVSVTIGTGMPVTGIVPGSATGSIAALLAGTVFEGSLSGATIQANGVNLQSQLLINFINGNGSEAVNPSGGNVRIDSAALIKDVSEPDVTNTASETDLYSKQIAAGLLSTNRFLHINCDFEIIGIVAAATVTIRLRYAGVELFTLPIANPTGGLVANVGVALRSRLHARNSANSQSTSSLGFLESSSLNIGGIANLFTLSRIAASGADSSIVQDLDITAQWSGASPSNSIFGLGLDIDRR
jgi:hypothetical protein